MSIYSLDKNTMVSTLDEVIEIARKRERETISFSIDGDDCYSACCADGIVRIEIKSGTHYVGEPIEIHSSNVIISGCESRLVGGIKATSNWKKYDGRIAYMDVADDVDGLYIGGVRYSMARYPKVGYGGHEVMAKARHASKPIGGYIHALHAKHWGGFSYKITGKSLFGRLKYVGGTQNNRPDGIDKESVYTENIFENMTEPGEWCYVASEKRVYAIPFDDADMDDTTLITNACIFKVVGARNVTIENIDIVGTRRTFMETREPLLRSDWTIYRGGAIYVTQSGEVTIDRCNMLDIGSNAIFVDGDNENIRVTRTHIKDCSASGVCFVGRSDAVYDPLFRYEATAHIRDISLEKGARTMDYPRHSLVEDCLIEHIGMIEKQASGVEIAMSYAISIKHTSIYNTSRAGINIGDGCFGGHLIEGCDIFDTVKETGDHGSFNSWGRDRFWNIKGVSADKLHEIAMLDNMAPTVIRGNRFRCDRGWDIDLDDGSSGYEIAGNLCLAGGIKLREGFYRNVHHNVTLNNSIHTHVWYPNSHDKVTHNIVFMEYQPVLMDNGWGDEFDYNILYDECTDGEEHADALSAMSQMDTHSRVMKVKFDEGYAVIDDRLEGYVASSHYGVRYEPLMAIREEPIIPSILAHKGVETRNTCDYLGMKLKDIDTDGEMSTYGTDGHNGAIVLAVETDSIAYHVGVRENDVIVNIAGREMHCVNEVCNSGKRAFRCGKVTVLRGQILTKL